MKSIIKFILWCAVFGGLVFIFHHFAPVQARALTDEETVLTLLGPDGPTPVTMAEYLPCAVAAEMPVSFGPEALKAQAVAARTYTLFSPRHDNADVCVDSRCCLAYKSVRELQESWGDDFQQNMDAIIRAVADTDGQYLTYGGEVIEAVFHASSAVATEDSANLWSAQPYLVSVASPETAESVPGLVTTVSFTPGELGEKLDLAPEGSPETWLGEISLDSAGRVESIVIASRNFSGRDIRSALGLRSTAFTVSWDGESFVFSVSGYGHGVGMSQYGAMLLGAEGWSYADILAHYYPGTELVIP